MLLLTDGSIMCKSNAGGGNGNIIMKLTPDKSGSYLNGTWSTLAPMLNDRLYYATQVLQDGRVYAAGGEYGSGGSLAEIYDPVTNVWTSIPNTGGKISDANSEILPDGRVLQSMLNGTLRNSQIFDPKTNTYTTGPTSNGNPNESAWVKLPDSTILMVNIGTRNSERYFPATNKWVKDATVPVDLYDAYGGESGTAYMLPDGRAFFTGSPGSTAFYTPSGNSSPGTWAAGPSIPNALGQPDAPGAMMVNGKILLAVNPVPQDGNVFIAPVTFYEFDYLTNTFTSVLAPSGGTSENYKTFICNMLTLPDGTVMYNSQNDNQYYIYKPVGTQLAIGKPAITSVYPNTCDGASYTITGTKFNGISEGACYGDDWQMSSNYPIIRLTSGTNVYYARTTNWNSTSVWRGSKADKATFTLPAGLPAGTYSLVVTCNGYASDPVQFTTSSCSAPVVNITSPANNASFAGPASVAITATATTTSGTISKVEFYNGTTLLGTSTASPYTFIWTNVTAGTYVITAKATNSSGMSTTSTGVTIKVTGNAAPTVSITSPASNAVFTTPATVNIAATAADADGTISKVEFYQGTILLGTDATSPYTYAWTGMAAGTYSLTAKAYDNSTGVTTSTAVSITVSAPNTLPTVSITSPANGATFTAPATVSIAANAADADGTISKVEFYNGTTLLGSDAASPYTYSWTSVAAGTYAITAKAYDNANGITTSSAVSITVGAAVGCSAPAWNANTVYVGDASLGDGKGEVVSYNGRQYRAQWWTQNNLPTAAGPWLDLGACATGNVLPTVTLTSPSNNAAFTAPATVAIAATAADADGSISKVEFYQGTTLLGSDAASPYTFSWTGVAAGTYSITAKAYDNTTGITTSSAVSITVNPAANILPTVSLTSPSNNAVFTAPATVSIAATAADADGSISKVEFYQGTTLLGSDAASPYTFSWTGVAAGTYSITAKAYDNTTGITTSSAVSITVNPASNILPTVSLTSPASGATFTAPATVSIAATAADADGSISKVEFYQGTTLLGSDAASPYTFSWTGVAAGTYSITAKAYDNTTGITTSSAVSITVNPAANILPTVSLTSPASGATFTAPATVSIAATAADADGSISKVEFYQGTALLGSDAASPYTYSWTSVAAGTYSITAKAYDNTTGITTSTAVSITVSPAQTGTVNCTNIAGWNASSIYLKGEYVTYLNNEYKANYWTQNNNPSTSSNGSYDFWLKIGDCISGTAPASAKTISMTPATTSTVSTGQTLTMNVKGLSSGNVMQATYTIFSDTNQVVTYTKTGSDLTSTWTSTTPGTYQLRVVVKDENGMLVYSDTKIVKVDQTTGINLSLLNTDFALQPNPTTGLINFNIGVDEVTVYDLTGKLLGQEQKAGLLNFDLSPYKSGIYVLQLKVGSETIFQKVIKE